MRERHPSFGPAPPDEFARAVKAPAIVTAQIIRKYVPAFGGARNKTLCKKFQVHAEAE